MIKQIDNEKMLEFLTYCSRDTLLMKVLENSNWAVSGINTYLDVKSEGNEIKHNLEINLTMSLKPKETEKII